MKPRSLLTAAALAATTAPALARPGHSSDSGALAGLLHPLSGGDHVLAMVAVGLWAGLLGGRATWMVPASFVLAMIFGFVLGVNGMVLPAIEPGIAASIFVLGMLVATSVRLSLVPSVAVVGLFGLFHGQAHGSELAGEALMFGAGFTISTILLHGVGLAIGGNRLPIVRLLGAVIAGSGLLFLGALA